MKKTINFYTKDGDIIRQLEVEDVKWEFSHAIARGSTAVGGIAEKIREMPDGTMVIEKFRMTEVSIMPMPAFVDAFGVGQEAMRHYSEGLSGKLPIIFRWPKWLPFALLALSLVLLTLGIGT